MCEEPKEFDEETLLHILQEIRRKRREGDTTTEGEPTDSQEPKTKRRRTRRAPRTKLEQPAARDHGGGQGGELQQAGEPEEPQVGDLFQTEQDVEEEGGCTGRVPGEVPHKQGPDHQGPPDQVGDHPPQGQPQGVVQQQAVLNVEEGVHTGEGGESQEEEVGATE